MLGAHRFDAVIHGHKHLPRVSSWLTTSNQPILVLGAGSFSATIEAKNAGLVQNYFHVLEIDHRDASDGLLRGRVKSWAYFIPDGWQAGPPVLGIDHVVPFGCYQPISTLAPAVQRVIDDRLNGGADHVLWRHILAAIPDLSYLHPNAARMLVEGLSVNGLISQGEVPDTIFIRP